MALVSRRILLSLLAGAAASALIPVASAPAAETRQSAAALSAENYPSIQEALDKNPGKIIYVPPGDYTITEAIKLTTPGSGLWGPGRIIQATPEMAILTLSGGQGITVRDLNLTRAEGKFDALREGIAVDKCDDVIIDGVSIVNNRSQRPTIRVSASAHAVVKNCLVENYNRIGIDDRTKSADWNFAFRVIDGTGMDIRDCVGALIQNNRIIENVYKPTEEIKKQYDLGVFSKMNPTKGQLVSDKMWAEKYYNAWHQGAAIHLASPEIGDCDQVIGNYMENAAQGMDIQADHVIVANNIVNNAFIGMKAMHGSRNVIITGNQFVRNDLWAIGLMPGASSHYAADPTGKTQNANVDGHSIIANNIISDFGYGNAYWMWKDASNGCYAIRLERGQKDSNPPLTDVIVEGNVIYDTGRDKIIVDGKPQVEPPRYKYAVMISPPNEKRPGPVGVHFHNNLFDPGTGGVSNLELSP